MINKIYLLLLFVIFNISQLYSQNTIETPNLSPDTNNVLSIPSSGGGGGGGGISTGGSFEIPAVNEKGNSSPLELNEAPSPLKEENKMEEEILESPSRSEPVPGAEILIEQEQNDIPNQTPSTPNNSKNKSKKKNKGKTN